MAGYNNFGNRGYGMPYNNQYGQQQPQYQMQQQMPMQMQPQQIDPQTQQLMQMYQQQPNQVMSQVQQRLGAMSNADYDNYMLANLQELVNKLGGARKGTVVELIMQNDLNSLRKKLETM